MQLQNCNVTKKAVWMPCPAIHTTYPGLAYICPLDELIIAEVRDALHDVIGDRARISYTIFNNEGQKVFLAVRKKKWKRFTIKIYNNYGNEVIEVRRPFKLCVNRVLVWAPPGHFAGSVEQVCNNYAVKNCSGDDVLTIKKGLLSLVYNIHYVIDSDINAIGVIKQQCPGVSALDVKNYGVSFPVQLDVRDKAVLLGACFLIGCLKY